MSILKDEDDTKIITSALGDVELIRIIGNIDLYNIPDLKLLFDKLKQSNRNKIVIDLQNVKFIDSSGLGILVTQALYLQKRNSVLKFINVNSTINHVFSLGGFTRSFKKFINQEAALFAPWEIEV